MGLMVDGKRLLDYHPVLEHYANSLPEVKAAARQKDTCTKKDVIRFMFYLSVEGYHQHQTRVSEKRQRDHDCAE